MNLVIDAERNRLALIAQLYDDWHGWYVLRRIVDGTYQDVRTIDRAEALTIRLAPDEALEVKWE